MKIIAIDNYNRDSVADMLVAENVPDDVGQIMVDALNQHRPYGTGRFFVLKPNGYRLWRGMEELV